jgi:WXG100 family type VII secretion target
MARFEVTISEMQNSANKISQAAEAFLDAAEAVMAGANDLASEWEGDSQVAFVAEQEKANQWYKKMVDIVRTYVESLNNAAKTYQEADEASAANIKSH